MIPAKPNSKAEIVPLQVQEKCAILRDFFKSLWHRRLACESTGSTPVLHLALKRLLRSAKLPVQCRICAWIMPISLCALPACQSTELETRKIQSVLDAQVAAWNRGDIEGFMQGYWNSEALEFRSSSRVSKGWQATLEGYKQKYNTREKMGTLEFKELKISPLKSNEAQVTGEFQLHRKESPSSAGRFELLFRKIKGQWLIVRDQTN